MRARVLAAAALLCAAAASGCREGGGRRAARTGVQWLDERHDPVNVRLAYDTANRVSRLVDSSGATITATGEDGTFFTLEIPKGALHARERISVIPVKHIDGLPLEQGGGVGMVQLEPEGLRFARPVRLTIEVEKPVPASEQLAFAWIADGRDTHLYPARGDSLEMHLQLLHFSGYGFGKAPPSDPGRIHLLYASAQEARLEAKVAEMVERERRKILGGEDETAGGAELATAFSEAMIEYYDGVVAPTMKIAETDDRMAECALRFYLGWLRQIELLGAADDKQVDRIKASEDVDRANIAARAPSLETRIAQGDESATRILDNVATSMVKRAEEGCRQHDLAAYGRVIDVYRQFMLLGANDTRLPSFTAMYDKAQRTCNRWEIELVSDVESRLPSGASRFQVASTAQYNADEKGAEAPLNYRALEISGNPWREVMDALSGGNGAAMMQKGSPFRMMNVTTSKRGSRHGAVRVLGVSWSFVKRDTVGTSCEGRDEAQTALVADSVEVTLRIEPPTEIVRFTHVDGLIPPHDEDMHEWMRYFTQFRMHGGDEIGSASGKGDDVTPEEQQQAQVLVIKVKPQEPGVWRAAFDTREGAMGGGKGLSETGHVVLRHVPQ